MRVVWTESALDEVARIYDYVLQFNPSAATGLVEALLREGDSLMVLPYRGRPVADNIRELVFVYPYIIRYQIIDHTVVILRVRHGMRS